MTNLPQVSSIQHATPEQAEQLLTSVPVFKLQQPTTDEEMAQAQGVVSCLSKPAPRSWLASRVYATLSHYFTPDHDADLVKMIADDWADILREYPAWAVSKACKWWLGRENPHHHRKPVPGDIQERAHKEMDAVRAAKIILSKGIAQKPSGSVADWSFNPVEGPEADERRRRAAEILKSVGFRSNMGGDNGV